MSALLYIEPIELKMTTLSHGAYVYSPGLCLITAVWHVACLSVSGLETKLLIKIFDIIKILLR